MPGPFLRALGGPPPPGVRPRASPPPAPLREAVLNTRVLRLHMPDPLSPLPGPAAWHVMCGDGSPALDPEPLEGRPGPVRLGDSKGRCHPPTVAWVAEPLAVSRALRCLHRPWWPAQASGPWFLPKAGGPEQGAWLAQLSGRRDHPPPCLGRPVPCLSVCHVCLSRSCRAPPES